MLQKAPKVTVFIGTYNRPDYLKVAIQSVVDQTMTDWECIVMNDGGVNVEHVVNAFNDDRIVYYDDTENKGLAHRLNFGLKIAKGDYIAYLGDDDLFYPHHFEVLSATLDKNPDIGLAYSDLYAVLFIKDEKNGMRYPLSKSVQVSRDFNRDFMWYFNHTLHVSILHRRELALKVDGYDENVKVLIDWNLTRKLAFYTDFKYVPEITGEYYMPIFKSDRISVLERKDDESFKHNLRKIKADLPPEPWPYVEKVAVVLPVSEWGEETNEYLKKLLDATRYPFKLMLINKDRKKNEVDIRESLGTLAELKNVYILTPDDSPISELEEYYFGADKSEADYFYFLDETAKPDLEIRVLIALDYMKQKKEIHAVKLLLGDDEKEGEFNFFINKAGLDRYRNKLGITMDKIPPFPPRGLAFDLFFNKATKSFKEKKYQEAYNFLQAARSVKVGIPGEQYTNDLHIKLAKNLNKFSEAEEKCRSLINRGYTAENWIKLGGILQAQGKYFDTLGKTDQALRIYKDAIENFQKGLKQIGFRWGYLESEIFPIAYPIDFDIFTALIGLGECYLETGKIDQAIKSLGRAFKTKKNSPRPFLGFAKMYLKNNDIEQAKQAIRTAGMLVKQDPEINLLTGKICEMENRPDLAYNCYAQAFKSDETDPRSIELVYRQGSKLKKWQEIKPLLEKFLEHHPANVPALTHLAETYVELGDMDKAYESVIRGLALDRYNENLLNISFKVRHSSKKLLENGPAYVDELIAKPSTNQIITPTGLMAQNLLKSD